MQSEQRQRRQRLLGGKALERFKMFYEELESAPVEKKLRRRNVKTN